MIIFIRLLFLKKLGYEFVRDEERKKWEENLKIGDIIDCIKFECF